MLKTMMESELFELDQDLKFAIILRYGARSFIFIKEYIKAIQCTYYYIWNYNEPIGLLYKSFWKYERDRSLRLPPPLDTLWY